MYLAGITDEAGADIATQIRVTRELGWKHLELRKVAVGGEEPAIVHDIDDAAFEEVASRIEEAGLKVSCISSTIANWGKSVFDPFEITLEEIDRCIPRMKRMGVEQVRIMSYQVIKDADGRALPLERQEKGERFRRVAEIVRIFGEAGLTPVHENCMNYGGMGWKMTLELLEAVPGLALVFDTGNPVFAEDFTRPEPRPMQDAWEFYSNVRESVAYVHVKDGVWNPAKKGCDFCYPGEGEGKVREVLADLVARGYTGGVSIEPHMANVFHDAKAAGAGGNDPVAVFTEYGRRLQRMLDDLGAGVSG